MKSSAFTLANWILAFACLTARTVQSAPPVPDYRGKVVLIVDQTVLSSPEVSSKITRLSEDLVGDGWRVLRYDVPRGETPGTPTWSTQVREIRALIQADYYAAPTELKSVFLLGHPAVPYSGGWDNSGITGNHISGAHPADSFYGEMTSPFGTIGSESGVYGWTDTLGWTPPLGAPNDPNDGRYDQNQLPSAMELAVGRLDLHSMPAFGANETELLSRYLEKNHDFRTGIFSVQRRALKATYYDTAFCGRGCSLAQIGPLSEYCDYEMHWFPNVKDEGQDYLFAYGAGWGTCPDSTCVAGLGATYNIAGGCCTENNFVAFSSRVVFAQFYGSYIGLWERENSFLRAPLANRYDPINGYHGYGLTSLYGPLFGLEDGSIAECVLGSTIGEALFPGYQGSVNDSLMGDPTLRFHVVRPVSQLTTAKTTTTVTLTWTCTGSA